MAIQFKRTGVDKVEQQMTPMIDIVFQLLAFFIMTFRVIMPEGDFSINMPQMPSDVVPIEVLDKPVIRIALTAKPNGDLESIVVDPSENATNLGTNFKDLATWIQNEHRSQLQGPSKMASDQEIELLCDYKLKYGATMEAVSVVSGRIDPQTGKTATLFEKIKFSRPKKNR